MGCCSQVAKEVTFRQDGEVGGIVLLIRGLLKHVTHGRHQSSSRRGDMRAGGGVAR